MAPTRSGVTCATLFSQPAAASQQTTQQKHKPETYTRRAEARIPAPRSRPTEEVTETTPRLGEGLKIKRNVSRAGHFLQFSGRYSHNDAIYSAKHLLIIMVRKSGKRGCCIERSIPAKTETKWYRS
jgi:hypothetical protein